MPFIAFPCSQSSSKDIVLDIPVTFVHPLAVPPPDDPHYSSPASAYPYTSPVLETSVYPDLTNQVYPVVPMSPPPFQLPYVDQNHVWLPPSLPLSITPQPLAQPYPYLSPQIQQVPYFGLSPPLPNVPVQAHGYTPRPLSASANISVSQVPLAGMGNAPASGTEFEPEEGKGERALRVATHLRLSSRHRSVSPQSHRYPLPLPPSHVEAPPIKHFRSLPPPPLLLPQNNLFGSPPALEGVVHSPRPQLTPKHSFTIDPITHHTLPKSERVEHLERMADAVVERSKDLSADLPKTDGVAMLSNRTDDDLDVDVHKTLPSPPVPAEMLKSNTYQLSSPSPPTSTQADANSSLPPTQPPQSMLLLPSDEKTPPTPTLMAVHPTRYPRANDLLGVGGCGESGLDALERRLLMEVGTRKLDPRRNNDKRPDALSAVMPIAIPNKSPEPLNDSAISSLTLADHAAYEDQDYEHEPELDHDSDAEVEAKTHRGGRSSGSWEDRGRSTGNVTDGSRGARGRGRPEALSRRDEKLFLKDNSGKTEKKGKKKASDKMRSKTAAKGRVAAWLGGIDPDVPPQEEEVIPPSPSVARTPSDFAEPRNLFDVLGGIPVEPAVEQTATAMPVISPQPEVVQQDISSAPNPRSSGFMPLATLKRDPAQRHLVTKEMSVVEEARRVASLWSSASPVVNIVDAPFTLPSQPAMQSARTERRVSPPSTIRAAPKARGYAAAVCPSVRNVWKLPDPTIKGEADAAPAVPPKKAVQPSPRLPAFPPLATQNKDPEVKYDFRSARGGRGGKVAAVASIWASAAANNNNTAGDFKPKVLRDGVTSPSAKPVRSPGKHATPTPPRLGPAAEPKARDSPHSPVPLTSRKPPKVPRKLQSATGLSTTQGGPVTNIRRKSTDALAPKRVDQLPTTKVFRSPGQLTPTNLSSPALSTTEPRLHELTGKKAEPQTLIKSSSVPAVISPSHATPMLSSTASLARPRTGGGGGGLKVGPANKAPIIGLGPPSSIPSQPRGIPAKSAAPGDLAFGQARLRDLIKKYQGQG